MRFTPVLLSVPRVGGALSNPILLMWAFAWRRRWRRALALRSWAAGAMLVGMLLVALLAVAAWQVWLLHGTRMLQPLLMHPFPAAVIAGAIAWAVVARSRRRAGQGFVQSWLASAPISTRNRGAAICWVVAAEVFVPVIAILAMIASTGMPGAAPVTRLLWALAAGFLVGAAGGWRSGAVPKPGRATGLPRLRIARTSTSLAASLAPLHRLPFAQLRAGADPAIEVRLIGALLLSLPNGIPPLIALLVVALCIVSLAALALLRATLAVVAQTAEWLRATPLRRDTFARALGLRALAWQVVFAVVGGLLASALGAATRAVALLGVTWLGICVLAMTITVALACRHRQSRRRVTRVTLPIMLAFSCVSALDTVLQTRELHL